MIEIPEDILLENIQTCIWAVDCTYVEGENEMAEQLFAQMMGWA